MGRSLLQIALDLQTRVEKLEKRVEELAQPQVVVTTEPKLEEAPSGRSMCPKCGVKPNYFFHVKTCTGQKDGDKATDRQRDQS